MPNALGEKNSISTQRWKKTFCSNKKSQPPNPDKETFGPLLQYTF